MKNKNHSIVSIWIILFLCSMVPLNAQKKHQCNHDHSLCSSLSNWNSSKRRVLPKLKVYVLAGQSNADGNGDVDPFTTPGTLSNYMLNGGSTEFDNLQTADGEWASRDDVWVRFDHEQRGLLSDELTVGFGWSENHIGPELGLGHLLGEHEENQVLIIKTCWGGKSLKEDFRPPSSGGTTGAYYQQMISDISSAIENVSSEFPEYQNEQIEMAGFVWFQGWNDGEDASYYEEYEQNLTNLISDVRSDLNVPELPVVVALTGNGGRTIEPEEGWIQNLQTKIVEAQINAVESNGLKHVAIAETRDFWIDADLSPEPDFLHHWNNNAESYLRIGREMGLEMIGLLEGNTTTTSSVDYLGFVQPNTNMALPSAYNFQEYVFGEPDDQGDCQGIQNNTAIIEEIFMAQTHRHEIGHPLFFTIGERPALLQLAVTGSGEAPDVIVEGILDGNNLGTMCLKGPSTLSASINLEQPNFEDYFSVTLPKAWVKEGLELTVSAGNSTRTLTQEELKISPFTELNLVMVNMDAMDYNHEPYNQSIFDNFLAELASAIPASVVRFGEFPETLRLPTFAFSSWQEEIVVTSTDQELGDSNTSANTGNLNYHMGELVRKIQRSTGDYPNTVFYGNTLNLQPGGWGGDNTFVSFDFKDNFIHELGHALGCPHWGEFYRIPNPSEYDYSYPFEGEEGEASGRGTAWNFIQGTYEFVSPTCQDDSGVVGTERSDCMQRGFACIESRPSGPGPWDGFGSYSAKAMNNYLAGSERQFGQVEDRGEMIDFHFPEQGGHPFAEINNGIRTFTRANDDPTKEYKEDEIRLPGETLVEQDVYLVYGSAHFNMPEVNIIYDPIKYKGTLPPVIDPTDPETFEMLKNLTGEDAPDLYGQTRDITLKLIYTDGTEAFQLVPLQSYSRPFSEEPDEILLQQYFAVVVPGEKSLCSVEMYHRDFIITDYDVSGNITDPNQNITAANFMVEATLITTLDYSCNCPGSANYVEPGTPCDDGNPFTINDVEDGFCNCVGTPAPGCGLITNSEFSQTLAGWRWWGIDISSDDDEAAITIENENDAGFGFDLISVEVGESYTVSFDAYAIEDRPLRLLHQAEYDFENDQEGILFLEVNFDITTTKTRYEMTYEVTENGNNSLLEFNFSGSDTGIFLDNICLESGCGTTEIPYNGLDDDCDPATPDDDLDQDGFAFANDCDDNNPSVNPNQMEIPYNGLDDDCNPVTLDDDLDQDGWNLINDCDDINPNVHPFLVEIPYNGLDDDCNPATLDDDLDQDGFAFANDCDDNNASINPAVTDIPDNGIDENCDGEDATNILDADGDGFDNTVDCDDSNPSINPSQPEVPYNGIDEDCNPATLDDDLDQDGFVMADDCDDGNPSINPNQPEVPYNGIDEDCNPATLDDDFDQDGFVLEDDCDDGNSSINPNQPEVPYNGIDEDCNPATLDDDLDQDGFVMADDCDDGNSSINPNQPEVPYNGIDEDCNPATLDDDLDQDGFVLEDDCHDSNPSINPNQPEVPYNGIDEDCNPTTLDDDLDQDGFVLADDCDDGNSSINPEAEDIPNNGIDEDCDGMDFLTSTQEISDVKVNIFPNPASEFIYVEFSDPFDYVLNLYDLNGKLIISEIKSTRLNVGMINAGIYLLEVKIKDSNQIIIKRIIVEE